MQLQPPYALVTAGASLHWMDWNIVMPRFAELLLEGAYLAGVGTTMIPSPWTLLGEMLSHYRTDRYIAQPHDVQEQHLFQVVGKRATETISFVQSVDDVVASYHSRVGFSRERMGSVQAAAFDQEAKETLLKAYPSGMVPFQLRGHVVWGFPKKKEELLFSQPAEMRHRQDIPRYPGSPHAFLEERMPIDNVLMGEARWGAISYAFNG